MEKKNQKIRAVCIAAAMIVGLILTRGISLDYCIYSHPDEPVFYGSTEALMLAIFHGEKPYEPIKAYPEGTYIFRLPFQLLAQKLPMDAEYAASVAIWGRISSVFSYSIGCLLGLWLVYCVLGGGIAGAAMFALTVIFGLFQIEQSRYGTFDPISFFLIALLLVLISLYIRKNKKRFLYTAAFSVGVLAAGKYPLALFFVLPFSVLLMEKLPKKETWLRFCIMAGLALVGFLLFSPSVLQSPRFLLTTVLGGVHGYIGGNPEGFATLPDKIISFLAYHLFYSDLPAAPVFAVLCAIKLYKGEEKTLEQKFYAIILPTFSLFFLAYNLLLKTFFFRTLFPFFCIAMLYACAGMGRLCRGKTMRWLSLALCALMVARGALLLFMLSDRGEEKYSSQKLQSQLDGRDIKSVEKMGVFFKPGFELETLSPEVVSVGIGDLWDGNFPEMESGQAILTCSMEHGWAKYCLFPPRNREIINITEGWEQFKADNEPYLVGKLFPDYIYWLFGFWTHGSTMSNYEFPSNWLYYKP